MEYNANSASSSALDASGFDFNVASFPGSAPPAAGALQGEYDVIPLSLASVGSPYNDLLSGLQDQTSVDTVKALNAFLLTLPTNHLRSVVSTLAKVHADNLQPTDFVYVPKDNRGKRVITVKTIAANAPLANVLIAARQHGIPDVERLVDGWRFGRKENISMINGGLPVVDEDVFVMEIVADFEKLVAAAAIGGRANPVNSQVVEWTKKNLAAIKQQAPGSRVAAYTKFLNVATTQMRAAVDLVAKGFYDQARSAPDSFEGENARGKFAAACHQWRLAATQSLNNGRASRGTDNPSVSTTPWYRYTGVMKAVNRLAFILAITGGRVAQTTSAQVSQAFSVDSEGWYVFVDNDVGMETLLAKLTSAKLIDANLKLAPKVLVQVNVLGNETQYPFDKTFKFLSANTVRFGWAIHDGQFFVTAEGGRVNTQIPKMLAQVAAVNNLRTLNAHAPYLALADANVLASWYHDGTPKNALVPSGTFTGLTFDVELREEGESKRAKAMDFQN